MEEFVSPYVNHIGSCTHPNGTVFLLVTHKVGNGQLMQRSIATILRIPEAGHRPYIRVRWPAGFGTLECLPDGSLFVCYWRRSADNRACRWQSADSPKHGAAVDGARERCSAPARFRKAVVPTQSARSQAATALDVARNAQAAADAANHTAEKARADAQAAAATVNKLGIPISRTSRTSRGAYRATVLTTRSPPTRP